LIINYPLILLLSV
jgi:predicted peroxiredoxin